MFELTRRELIKTVSMIVPAALMPTDLIRGALHPQEPEQLHYKEYKYLATRFTVEDCGEASRYVIFPTPLYLNGMAIKTDRRCEIEVYTS